MAVDNKTPLSSDLLRRLHSLQTQVAELEGQLKRGPRQIKAGEAMVVQATEKLETARQNVKTATMACDEKQLQLQGREDRIEDLKAKLNTASSNKEFDLLKEQIAADQQANSVQSDEILEGLERIDQLNEAVKEADKELAQVTKEQKERAQSIEGRMEVVAADLDHVRVELEKYEKEIPVSLRGDYRRLYEGKGAESLAPVEDGCCEGCNQTLTTQMIDRIRLQVLVPCPSCSAWLYEP
ncbi:MAG: phospholipase [Planctomycetota bacterium]